MCVCDDSLVCSTDQINSNESVQTSTNFRSFFFFFFAFVF